MTGDSGTRGRDRPGNRTATEKATERMARKITITELATQRTSYNQRKTASVSSQYLKLAAMAMALVAGREEHQSETSAAANEGLTPGSAQRPGAPVLQRPPAQPQHTAPPPPPERAQFPAPLHASRSLRRRGLLASAASPRGPSGALRCRCCCCARRSSQCITSPSPHQNLRPAIRPLPAPPTHRAAPTPTARPPSPSPCARVAAPKDMLAPVRPALPHRAPAP